MSTHRFARRARSLLLLTTLAATGVALPACTPATTVGTSTPLYDSPGALVPTIVTAYNPPAGYATTLTATADRGATVTCTGGNWRNYNGNQVSRKCYIRLPSSPGTVAITGKAVFTKAGATTITQTGAGRPIEGNGYATTTMSIATAKQIERCHNNSSNVRLTFDDGGTAAQLTSILATLKRENVKGTFFYRGDWAAANPSLLSAIKADGHWVGNHSYNHPALSQTSDAGVLWQIDRGTAANVTPKLLRPPFAAGALTNRIVSLAAQRGYQVCRWTTDTYDWDQESVATMARRIEYGDYRSAPIEAGGNILMHGTAANTVSGLQTIIDTVRSMGFTLQPRV